MSDERIFISNIYDMPIGRQFGGLQCTVKTAGKAWNDNERTYQHTVLADSTGEIPADILIGQKLTRNAAICVNLAEVQEGRKLLVKKYAQETVIGEPEGYNRNAYRDEARGKTKCRIACSLLEKGENIEYVLKAWPNVLKLTDKIMDRDE